MEEHVKALTQSYTRTKAKDYKSFRQTMELHTNSSNNTIFADADGDIAYFHGNFIPRRDASFDWTKPVDGTNPATEWKGLLSIEEIRVMFDSALAAMENASGQADDIGDVSAAAWTGARRSIERHMRAAIRPPLDDSPG